jgi:DNA-binding MarR family transcriptional regulator
MDQTTLTAAVKPLHRRGLLKITPDQADRRARVMALTAKGKKLLARAVPIWKTTHEAVEDLLPDGNPNRFRKDLWSLSRRQT